MTATAPIVVAFEAPSLSTYTVPPWEALGRSFVLALPARVIAFEPTTLTTERDGVRTLAAGENVVVLPHQRVTASERVFVTAGYNLYVPPVEQLRNVLFSPRRAVVTLRSERTQQVTTPAAGPSRSAPT